MAELEGLPSSGNTKVGAVAVNVTDYKLFIDEKHDELLEAGRAVFRLLADLRKHKFLGEREVKVIAQVEMLGSEIGRKLALLMSFGSTDSPFMKRVEIPVPTRYRGESYANLHNAMRMMSKVEPGGNVPNMIRNWVYAMDAGIAPEGTELDLYSNSSPLFEEWYANITPATRERITRTGIGVEPRRSLHLPVITDDDQWQTMSVATPAFSSKEEMQPYIARLVGLNHVLVSESLTGLMTESNAGVHHYNEFQNPSSAFKQLCAIDAYGHALNKGKYIPTLSVNDEEMIKYIEALEDRRGLSSTNDEALDFKSPFTEGGTFNPATLKIAKNSFDRYFNCLSVRPQQKLNFAVNVSCGANGGYHVAHGPKGELYFVYSTIPDEEGTRRFISPLAAHDPKITLDTKQVMGAGDSVATILSMTKTWDLEAIVQKHASPDDPLNDEFITTAAIIFVSLLSRYVGAVLFHSEYCDWRGIRPEMFRDEFAHTVQRSLACARGVWGKRGTQVTKDPYSGIHIAFEKASAV